MADSKSKLVENFLAKPDVHREWVTRYRAGDNERFFEQAFDRIAEVLKPPAGATFLDVGCGTCKHSVRLALRGFKVRAVDLSGSALQLAQEYVAARGVANSIAIGQENLTDLSFADESFDYVLCWGVLMHIPDVGRAVSELSRVLKRGGCLVISEVNMRSPEAVLKRAVAGAGAKHTPTGVEFWRSSGNDALVTRQADLAWLKKSFEVNGIHVTRRVAGQFSEGYAVAPRPIKGLIHSINHFWFRHVRLPGLAYSNILFLQKKN
jgi:2-polyprenyl-3-methyl-5-hydroxy-6-metoxy-1,4-benzoquinol methylase